MAPDRGVRIEIRIELSRDLAIRFNSRYGRGLPNDQVFVVPDALTVS